MAIQVITTPGGEELVILPRAEYERLHALCEEDDQVDVVEALLRRVETGEEELFPVSIIDAILAGDNPVTVYRTYRGMSQKQLARLSGVPREQLALIEEERQKGSVAALKKLALALKLPQDMFLDP